MTERAVVTGGAGFIGSYLCERLLFEGAEVMCLDDLSTGRAENVGHLLEHPRFTLVEHDITIPFSPGGPPTAVVHLASPASPRAYLSRPIETLDAGSSGTRNALEVARAAEAIFLLASTSEVYGDPLVHPQPESYRGNVSPTGPRSVYDEAKRYGEALTMAYHRRHGMQTRIARIFNTYGPRMAPGDGRMVSTFVAQSLRGEPLTVYGDGSQTRSLCYVDDLVEGLLRLLRSREPYPVNLGSPEERSVLEVARLVLAATGSDSPIEFLPLPEDDPRVRCPDIARARRILDWEPTMTFPDGLARTVDWFRRKIRVPEKARSVSS